MLKQTGAKSGIRTHDLRVTNALLCQLSYLGLFYLVYYILVYYILGCFSRDDIILTFKHTNILTYLLNIDCPCLSVPEGSVFVRVELFNSTQKNTD